MPNNIKEIVRMASKVSFWSALIIGMIALKLAWFDVGMDYQQGEIFKFLYIHVPSAWFSQLFLMLAVISLLFHSFFSLRRGRTYPLILATLETTLIIGGVSTVMAVLTGYYWGQKVWGGAILWDPRLVAQGLILIVYAMTFAFYYLNSPSKTALYGSAMIGVIAIAVFIFNHFSVYWFSTIHQLPSVLRTDGKITIDPSMREPLWWSIGFFITISISLLSRRLIFRF